MSPPVPEASRAGGLSGREASRKGLHAAVGSLVFLWPWLGGPGLGVLALGLVVWNAWIFPPLGGRRLYRSEEAERGRSWPMVLYPAAVAVVCFGWAGRPEVAVGAWMLLAVGDAAATLVGRSIGGPTLPWNRRATVAGSAAFVLAATPAIVGAWTWLGLHGTAATVTRPWVLALTAALVGALLESLPLTIDDNVVVPIGGAFALDALVRIDLSGSRPEDLAFALGTGLVVNAVLAFVLVRGLGAADRGGAVAGCVLGTLLWVGLGPVGEALLVAFVGLGVGATRWGWARKVREGTAEARSGRRGARNALANLAVAAGAGLAAALTGSPGYVLGAAGALAAATADTLSSEVGQARGGRPVHLATLRRVEPGTNGAVTAAGSLAALGGAAAIALVAVLGGLLAPAAGLRVAAAGVVGAFVDSLLGATVEGEGGLDNEAVNLLATLAGALVASGSFAVVGW